MQSMRKHLNTEPGQGWKFLKKQIKNVVMAYLIKGEVCANLNGLMCIMQKLTIVTVLACIKKCYEDLHNSVTGRRPSNASIVSIASASHPSPASLTSNRSVTHVNIPGSPTANNNSYSQLVKILDASV